VAQTEIVHIRDWHYVPKEAFAIDTDLKGEELDRAYEQHLRTVEGVQKAQKRLLKGIKEVYVEGICERDMPIFAIMLPGELSRERRLRIGAAGQLMRERKLTALPAESDEFEQFNPVRSGTVELDEKEIEAREDAIVQRLLKPGKHYLILGGAHDLSDNLKRLSPSLARTGTAAWRSFAKLVQQLAFVSVALRSEAHLRRPQWGYHVGRTRNDIFYGAVHEDGRFSFDNHLSPRPRYFIVRPAAFPHLQSSCPVQLGYLVTRQVCGDSAVEIRLLVHAGQYSRGRRQDSILSRRRVG
jgi:hypothetical protein